MFTCDNNFILKKNILKMILHCKNVFLFFLPDHPPIPPSTAMDGYEQKYLINAMKYLCNIM